ncbi:Uncharacterised protein [Candidatus Burarchaeum australiense]|nr:Uncharacterised protein [Candidatus Burarchaeum australiense]
MQNENRAPRARASFAATALVLLFIFLVLALSGCAGLPVNAPGPSENQVTTSWLQDNWGTTSLLIVFVTILIISLVYLLAEFSQSKELHAWAVTEFFQAGMSMLIIFMLILLFSTLSQLSCSLVNLSNPLAPTLPCTSGEQQFLMAETYLSDLRDISLKLTHDSTIHAVKMIGKSTGKFSLVAVDLLPAFFSGFSMRYAAGVDIFSDRDMQIADEAMRLAASLNAQQLFLQYLQASLIPLLLIAGVVLRAIFFTRKLGGLLIAIAIALFTVYPLTYLLFQYSFPISLNVKYNEPTGIGIQYCEDYGDPLIDPNSKIDLATCCPRNDLYVEVPVGVGQKCAAACTAPNPAAPPFAQTACNDACEGYCKDATTPPKALYPSYDLCYRSCAATFLDIAFPCSMDAGCNAFAKANGGDADSAKYRAQARDYAQLNNLFIASCNDYVVSNPLLDPYKTECSTCPSNANADCRITYRKAGISPPSYPNYFDEVLPGLPNACWEDPSVAEACKLCAGYDAAAGDLVTSAADAARLTILPDPEVQKKCTDQTSLTSGAVPALDSNNYVVTGDVIGLAQLIVAGLILPIFNFIITITFIKVFSPLLGGDIEIEGLMRLI